MNSYYYVIGDNPYDNAQSWREKGNGEWSTQAENINDALETIFNSMPFPTEMTGRYQGAFIDGISIPNLAEDEVVQVWSDDPQAQANRKHLLQAEEAGVIDHLPHFGKAKNECAGLTCEIPVYEIEKWLHPERKLLAAPTSSGTEVTLSQVGIAVKDFFANRQALVKSVTDTRLDMQLQKWELDSKERALRRQIGAMQEQLSLAETYLHGPKGKVTLNRGYKGTGPYHIFQTRQFLNKEVALLANLTDFDFTNLEQLDAWLISSGKLWSMLPFERTILVTRIRDTNKDYGCPWVNMTMAEVNMTSIIWIRDGQNVHRISVLNDFDNCVFPDGKEAEKMVGYVTEHIFGSEFSKRDTDWRGNPITEIPEGTIKSEALEEHEPYVTRTVYPRRFKALQDWMASEDFTIKIRTDIAQACNKSLSESNRRQMKFVLLLQGLVDNTHYLDIPKGTNLFDWQNSNVYFTLHNDYTHALPDGQTRNLIEAFSRPDQLRVGMFIITDAYNFERRRRHETPSFWHSNSNWRFYRIHRIKDGKIFVKHHFTRRNYPHDPAKAETLVEVKDEFIRACLPRDLAKRILEDRDWKEKNLNLVPLLAQWDRISKQYEKAKNFDKVYLKGANDE